MAETNSDPSTSDDELAIDIGDAYLLRGSNGNWYLSSDDTASDQDTLLFNSSNPFANFGNPFANDELLNGSDESSGNAPDGINPFVNIANLFDGADSSDDSNNPFAGGSISFPSNPFASDDELAIDLGDAYLLRGSNGNWYLSSDDTASDQDTLLFNSTNPFGDGNLPPIPSFVTDAST